MKNMYTMMNFYFIWSWKGIVTTLHFCNIVIFFFVILQLSRRTSLQTRICDIFSKFTTKPVIMARDQKYKIYGRHLKATEAYQLQLQKWPYQDTCHLSLQAPRKQLDLSREPFERDNLDFWYFILTLSIPTLPFKCNFHPCSSILSLNVTPIKIKNWGTESKVKFILFEWYQWIVEILTTLIPS